MPTGSQGGGLVWDLCELAAIIAGGRHRPEYQQHLNSLTKYFNERPEKIQGRIVSGPGVYSITRGAASAYCVVHGMIIPPDLAGAVTLEEIQARYEIQAARPKPDSRGAKRGGGGASFTHQMIDGFADEAIHKGLPFAEGMKHVEAQIDNQVDGTGRDRNFYAIRFDDFGEFEAVVYLRGGKEHEIDRHTVRKRVHARYFGRGSVSLAPDSG